MSKKEPPIAARKQKSALANSPQKPNFSDAGTPAHEVAYQTLKQNILYGEFKPGRPVTLQGIADTLDLSLTPIRESVRRLIAERALVFHGNRRISIPNMTLARLEDIYVARLSLEGELAFRAAKIASAKDISQLEKIDRRLDDAIADGDVSEYLKYNLLFHEFLYNLQPSEILMPIIETLWLQLGPSLRVVCGRYGTSGLSDNHKKTIAALREQDGEAARLAIQEDIMQGRQIVVEELSRD